MYLRYDDEGSDELFPFLVYGILLNSVGVLGLVGNVISVMILTRWVFVIIFD